MIYNGILLEDKQNVTEIKVYESGSIFLISSSSMEIEEYGEEVKKKIKDITESSESKLT